MENLRSQIFDTQKASVTQIRKVVKYFDNLTEILDYKQHKDKFKSVRIKNGFIDLHLDVCEVSKDAPTVVFIPGTSSYAMCFVEFLSKLSDYGYNIVGFDPRGHGRSSGRSGSYTITELIQDTNCVINYAIQRFGDNVSLMGTSQGGIVSLYTASTNTQLKSVICQNFALLGEDESLSLMKFPSVYKVLRPFLMAFTNWFPHIKIPVLSYVDFDKQEVKYFGNIADWLYRDPLTVKRIHTRALHSLATTKIPRKPELMTVPVLLLQPENDGIFPLEYVAKIFRRIGSKKRFVLIDKANHATLINDADKVANYVADWLNEIHYGTQPELEYKNTISALA